MEAGFLELEDGTGFLQLEGGTGNVLLEPDEFGQFMLIIGKESMTLHTHTDNTSLLIGLENTTLSVKPENLTWHIPADRTAY